MEYNRQAYFSRRVLLHSAMAASGLFALVTVVAVCWAQEQIAGVLLTRSTIWLSLTWYFASLMFMVQGSSSSWTLKSDLAQMARWCWTWGLVSYLAHFAAAFHFYHNWSHNHAFEHTQKVSGIGEGIYVSYLFTLVWIADAAWWWCHPKSHAARPIWTDRFLHGFMLFIVFNGSIVFAKGAIRWAAVFAFFALSVTWLHSTRRQRRIASFLS